MSKEAPQPKTFVIEAGKAGVSALTLDRRGDQAHVYFWSPVIEDWVRVAVPVTKEVGAALLERARGPEGGKSMKLTITLTEVP